jgi:hypothetical protein
MRGLEQPRRTIGLVLTVMLLTGMEISPAASIGRKVRMV